MPVGQSSREQFQDLELAGAPKKGSLVLTSVGAGFTVGAVLLRWGL